MSAQHTPGPWKTVSVYADFEVRTAEDALVAVVTPVRCESTENARLIAAAPEMLAALIVAREFISTDRNALADCSIDHEGRMSEDDAAAVADYDKALLQIDAAIQKATGGAA